MKSLNANIGSTVLDQIQFLKTRNVKSPNRANPEDAGIDFYIPYPDLNFIDDFVIKNQNQNFILYIDAEYKNNVVTYSIIYTMYEYNDMIESGITLSDEIIGYFIEQFGVDEEDDINNIKFTKIEIEIPGCGRILVPSGVKVWINPKNSALIATNKSGVATKKGLVVGATTVDSTYTGEVHLSVINTNLHPVRVTLGEKLVQFIHTPVILSQMVEVSEDEYNNISSDSNRGSGGFGSTGLK